MEQSGDRGRAEGGAVGADCEEGSPCACLGAERSELWKPIGSTRPRSAGKGAGGGVGRSIAECTTRAHVSEES